MKAQVAEVQKSQAKMWGAISRMGEELQGLAMKENDSESEHEAEAGPKDPPVETDAPRTQATPVIYNLADPVPPFGTLPIALAVSFRTFDATSVRDSVSSTVPKKAVPSMQEKLETRGGRCSLGRLPLRKKGNFWTE